MVKHRGLLVILDGLGDRPIPELEGRTPLEAANTPVMDRMITAGMGGFVSHILPGVPVGTQTGSGLILGLAPSDVSKLSRGMVQALGAGIDLQRGDVALRGNFATLDWGDEAIAIIDRRAGRIAEQTEVLAHAVNGMSVDDKVEVLVRASTHHRVAIVFRGEGLTAEVSNTDPGSGNKDHGLQLCRALDETNLDALRMAGYINTFLKEAHDRLTDHPVNKERIKQGQLPANGLITRGGGQMADLKNVLQLLKIKTALVSGEGTLQGLGRIFGFESIFRPEFTATKKTDLAGKVEAALDALTDHDLVVMHIKGPDVCAHDRNPMEKMRFIEAIDVAFEPLLDREFVVGITADHSTDSTTGRHTGDPVPSLISVGHMRKDAVVRFGESSCLAGGLGRMTPMGFLCTMLDLMNQMHNMHTHEYDFFV